jgi:hypothetical protein
MIVLKSVIERGTLVQLPQDMNKRHCASDAKLVREQNDGADDAVLANVTSTGAHARPQGHYP